MERLPASASHEFIRKNHRDIACWDHMGELAPSSDPLPRLFRGFLLVLSSDVARAVGLRFRLLFRHGRSIVGPIRFHYVFNTCSSMQAKAFDGQPYYPNRDWGEVDLICMLVIAFQTVVVTRGDFWTTLGSYGHFPPILAHDSSTQTSRAADWYC